MIYADGCMYMNIPYPGFKKTYTYSLKDYTGARSIPPWLYFPGFVSCTHHIRTGDRAVGQAKLTNVLGAFHLSSSRVTQMNTLTPHSRVKVLSPWSALHCAWRRVVYRKSIWARALYVSRSSRVSSVEKRGLCICSLSCWMLYRQL